MDNSKKISNVLRILAPVTLVLGLTLSGLLTWKETLTVADADRTRFERLSERFRVETVRRMMQYEYGLRGSASLWPASKSVEREEFIAMVENRDIAKEFPGATGIGFIQRVNRPDLPAFLATTRADNAPDFKLKTQGDAPDLYIIEYIVPLATNRAAEGFDVGQEPNRRQAAERAMLTGKAALTEPVTLVQAADEGPGFLIFFPVYNKGPAPTTPEERLTRLVGWTYMPIVAARVLTGLTHEIGGEIDFEIFAGAQPDYERLIFDADNHLRGKKGLVTKADFTGRELNSFGQMEIAGATWSYACSTTDKFQAASRTSIYTIALGGPLVSLLLAGLVLNLSRTTRKARELASSMTAELSAAVDKAERLALVATRTTNGVTFTDTQRRITWVNEGFTQLSGYTAEEAIGKKAGELLHCESTDPLTTAKLSDAIDKGVPFKGELLNRHKHGRTYWVEFIFMPLKDASGTITGFFSIHIDITESKKSSALLKEQAERTFLALQGGDLGLWDWHIPSGLTLFDERWASMLGEDIATLRPHVDEWVNRCHPDDLPRANAALQAHFRGNARLYQCLHRMKHHDGTWRWIMVSGKVMQFNPEGQPLRMVGTHKDVTEQEHARIELERSNTALNHTGRLARVGAWELDVINQTVFWSDHVRAIHEVPADYVPNLTTSISFYPGDAAVTITRAVTAAIEHGTPFNVELPLVTATGKPIWVRTLGESYRPDVSTHVIRGAFQDITETHRQHAALEEARAAAEAATRAKADFLANMSHEIRTPMNAVIGMTELLQHTPLDSEQVEFVGTIRTSGDALLSLINDILDFSKIESGQLDLEHIPVNLRDCVESALDLNARNAANKGLDLLVWIEPDVTPAIMGDVTRLRQIVTNLVNNAIKFTERGDILISIAARPGQLLHFSVRDTGIGIPADRLDRLFKSFSQVDNSTTRKYGGTGLGLAICQRLVTLMHGRIWVESVFGKGSTFHVEIPFQPAPYSPKLYQSDIDASLSGRRLLIVEDNETNRAILTRQTRGWGLIPQAVSSATVAQQLIDSGAPFDAVLLDVQMPGMDGHALARQLRRTHSATQLPIIILSSMGTQARDFDGLGIARILTKPTKAAVLLETLRQVFTTAPASSSEQPAATTAATAPLAQTHPFRILLAEDIDINKRVALLLFERLGYKIDVVSNGLEVLATVGSQPVDILFLDVQMPELDGLECAKRLCADYPREKRPWIVAMTANALEGDRETCLAAGMDDYISKPISGQAITKAILNAAAQLGARAQRLRSGGT